MYTTYTLCLVILIADVSSVSIPRIRDAVLRALPRLNVSVDTYLDKSCEECLCQGLALPNSMRYIALNCLSNRTCQFFSSFPVSYKIMASNGSRLYFLRGTFPEPSQCCVPNITELMIRLQNVVPTMLNLTFQPGGLGYDANIPSEVAVIGYTASPLLWFDPTTMSLIRNAPMSTSLTIASHNNMTFTAMDSTPVIHIRNRQTNAYLNNITYSTLKQSRKLLFLDEGRTLLVTTQANKSVTVFNVESPTNYTFREQIPVPVANAHGMAKVNDNLVYVSSWGDRRIVSCHYANATWTTQVFVNDSITASGSHIDVDDCGRVWFVNTQFGLRIYNSSGDQVAAWNMTLNASNTIYDVLLLPNYVVLISHVSAKKIVRYDPQLSCSYD